MGTNASSKNAQVEGRYSIYGTDTGASGSAGYNKAKADYKQVQQQTGLTIHETADLHIDKVHNKAGYIDNKGKKEDVNITVDKYSEENITNNLNYTSEGASVSADTVGGVSPGLSVPVNIHDSSTTHATISDNMNFVVESDKKTGKNSLANTHRDVATANEQVAKLDVNKYKEMQEASQLIAEQGMKITGNISQKMGWKDGSPQKVALHGLVAYLSSQAAGGNGGAGFLAGASSEFINSKVAEYLNNHTELGPRIKNTLLNSTSMLIGEVAGKTAGGGSGQGAAAALAGDKFNRQLHPDETIAIGLLKKDKSPEEQDRLDAAACYLVNCASDVPVTDKHYAELKQREEKGSQYVAEQKQLQGTGLFKYGAWDWAGGVVSKHDHLVSKTKDAMQIASGTAGTVGGVILADGSAVACG